LLTMLFALGTRPVRAESRDEMRDALSAAPPPVVVGAVAPSASALDAAAQPRRPRPAPAPGGPAVREESALETGREGLARAQWDTAQRYLEGRGVPRDEEKAFYWMRQAAAQGHEEAQWKTGWMYFHGVGARPSKARAVYWYYQSLKQRVLGERFGDSLRAAEGAARRAYLGVEPRAQRFSEDLPRRARALPSFLRRLASSARACAADAARGCRRIGAVMWREGRAAFQGAR
ncbi:MAG TPA: tetratricopeptide repeat protein, partial [Elusimicrobiota bacterium]|nr:tetratricopeptide repeat protein [Elusimicrobiota bacterium]